MSAKDIVAELKKLGNAQTKKTWMNHGAQEPCLGVKVGDTPTRSKGNQQRVVQGQEIS